MNLYNLVLPSSFVSNCTCCFVPGDKGDIKFFRGFFHFFLYEFILFERLSVLLKWILSFIFLCCRTVVPCPTLCHSDFLVDRHFLKFHGSFFLFILLAAAGSASPVLPLSYSICIRVIHSLSTNHRNFHQPWGSSTT